MSVSLSVKVSSSNHFHITVEVGISGWFRVSLVVDLGDPGDLMRSLWHFIISRPNLQHFDWLKLRISNGVRGATNYLAMQIIPGAGYQPTEVTEITMCFTIVTVFLECPWDQGVPGAKQEVTGLQSPWVMRLQKYPECSCGWGVSGRLGIPELWMTCPSDWAQRLSATGFNFFQFFTVTKLPQDKVWEEDLCEIIPWWVDYLDLGCRYLIEPHFALRCMLNGIVCRCNQRNGRLWTGLGQLIVFNVITAEFK